MSLSVPIIVIYLSFSYPLIEIINFQLKIQLYAYIEARKDFSYIPTQDSMSYDLLVYID